MKKQLQILISAFAAIVLLASCAGESVVYKNIIYEASSNPPVNMSVRMRFPKKDALYETAGSKVKQDCGFAPEDYEAEISADVIRETGTMPEDAEVTVKIYFDGVCVAENTGTNSASVTYHKEQ